MFFGPFYRQVLGEGSVWIRQWVMFRHRAVGQICKVRYAEIRQGLETPINRFKILGYKNRFHAPSDIKRISTPKKAVEVGKRLCRAVGGTNPDIRLYGFTAEKDGWHQFSWGESNLCSE